MDAQQYCELVEKKYRKHQILLPTIPIKEDNSPLISLKDSNFKLVYEPSINRNYKYMVREAVYEKVGRISEALNGDKVLFIRSVWRSYAHQRHLWEDKVKSLLKEYPEKSIEEIRENVSYFIAPPTKSMHTTGGAVDALIYDSKKDSVMDFGSNKGIKIELNDKCYPYHPFISTEAKKNRKILIELFEKEDFVVDIKEFWHFDYGNKGWALEKGNKYAIYDVIAENEI